MRKNETRTIGEATYEVTQLGALEGRRVLARIAQLLGGTVGAIAKTGSPDLVAALQSFAEHLTPDSVDYFCDIFAKGTQVHLPSGKVVVLKDVFDNHFAANYGEMISWLTFCLEVNFGSFLGENGLGAVLKRVAPTSNSQRG